MDVEKFIDCVRKHPVLYNTRHSDYKNLAKKSEIWDSIAMEMGITESSEVLRIKWKGLKDGYTKYKKQLLGIGGFPKCYNNWIWGPNLEFLEKYSKPRISTLVKGKRLQNLDLSQGTHEGSLSVELTTDNRPTDPLKIKTGSGTSEEDEEKAKKPTPRKRQKKSDAIDHLFMSYAETFRRFSPTTQAMIKVEMAKLFADSELQEYNYNHQVPSPTNIDVSVNVKSEYNS